MNRKRLRPQRAIRPITDGFKPVSEYPAKVIKAFIKGWDKIPDMVAEINDSEYVPFN